MAFKFDTLCYGCASGLAQSLVSAILILSALNSSNWISSQCMAWDGYNDPGVREEQRNITVAFEGSHGWCPIARCHLRCLHRFYLAASMALYSKQMLLVFSLFFTCVEVVFSVAVACAALSSDHAVAFRFISLILTAISSA